MFILNETVMYGNITENSPYTKKKQVLRWRLELQALLTFPYCIYLYFLKIVFFNFYKFRQQLHVAYLKIFKIQIFSFLIKLSWRYLFIFDIVLCTYQTRHSHFHHTKKLHTSFMKISLLESYTYSHTYSFM